MPRLKNPWQPMSSLIFGAMKTNHATMIDIGGWLGCHRTTASRKIYEPGSLTMDELVKLSVKLKIPPDELRDRIPLGG